MSGHFNSRYPPEYGQHSRNKPMIDQRYKQEYKDFHYGRRNVGSMNNPQILRSRPIPPARQWRETKSSYVPPPAAPFPVLPKKDEVLELKNEVDSSIKDYQIELSTLRQEQSNVDNVGRTPIVTEIDSLGVREVDNIITSFDLIDSIISQNRKSAKLANEEASVETNHKMLLATHAPFAVSDLVNHDELLPLMFTSVFYMREIQREKENALADQYDKMHEVWEKQCDAVDSFNFKEHDFTFRWPDEMSAQPTKDVNDEMLREVTAPDIKMVLDPSERETKYFWTEERLIEDPELEYQKFKSRLTWTDEEKKIFIEKYCAHPKEFNKIASYLPDKTVKDTIEFYYLNKELLNLDELQAAAKKRGSRKRVITEGAVKK